MSGRRTPLQIMRDAAGSSRGGSSSSRSRITTPIPASAKGKAPMPAPPPSSRNTPPRQTVAPSATRNQTPSAPDALPPRPSKRRLHQVGSEEAEDPEVRPTRKKSCAVKKAAAPASASRRGDAPILGVGDLPEGVRGEVAHLLPTINFLARHVNTSQALAYEVLSPEDALGKIGSFQAKMAYLLASNMDVLTSTISEGGQAQRLQAKLSEVEGELNQKLAEAKAEILSLQSTLVRTEEERDQARAEAFSSSSELEMERARATMFKDKLTGAEDELQKSGDALDQYREEIARVREDLLRVEAGISKQLEDVKVDAKIDGLEESIELIQMAYPDLDLDILHKVLRVARGEISEAEAFGPPVEDSEPTPPPPALLIEEPAPLPEETAPLEAPPLPEDAPQAGDM